MATFTIPNSQGQIRQFPKSDTFGELWETFSIDLTTIAGKIKPSKKLVRVLEEVADLNDETVTGFAIYKTKYYLSTTGGVLSCSVINDPTDTDNWSIEAGIAGTGISASTDLTVFGDLLLISQSTDITTWDGAADDTNWWTSNISGTALTTAKPHIMHVHRGGQETLFVTDNNNVRYYNATAGHSTVELQADLTASCIASGVSAIWVGTYTESQENAYVYEIYVGEEIDAAPVARNAYKVEGRAVLSIQVMDNIPYIVTERGNLQAFNGAGFSTVASLPFANSDDVLNGVRAGNVSDISTSRPVHPKGMQAHNDSLFININTDVPNSSKYPARTATGIWEYEKNTQNLTHRFAFSNTATQNGGKVGADSGPVIILDTADTFLLAGGAIIDESNGMFAVSNSATPFGYAVTAEIESGSVTDAWEAFYVKAKTLANMERIEFKYRIAKRDPEFISGAWLNTTTFNTTSATNVAIGDEITIIQGTNIGAIAHVVDVQPSTTVTSIVVDVAIGTVGTEVIEIQNFKKLDDTYTTINGEWGRFSTNESSPWIQYKIVFYGDIELRQFMNKSNTKIGV